MANSDGREALRGLEVPLFDFIPQVLASEEWTGLLIGLLWCAAFLGDRGLTHKLVRSGVIPVVQAPHGAVAGGHLDIVRELLEKGASVATEDTLGRTPLPVRTEKLAVVQLLRQKGADKDAFDDGNWTPLFTAVGEAHQCVDPTIVFALLAAGVDVNLRSDNHFHRLPLQNAAFSAGVDVMRALIEHGNDVNALDFTETRAFIAPPWGMKPK